MRRNWTPGEIKKLKKLREEGKSLADIADILGRSYDSVNSAFSHRFKKIPPSAFPVWDAPLTTQGDALILTDIEAPFQHSDFLNRCLDLADAWGVRTLHIGGDLIHYASLSKWAPNHGHSHRWSVNRDPSGTYWAIQTGHCVDETRLAYVMQRDAKRDAHALGATIIRGGYPFVLCEQSPFEALKRM